LGVAGLVDFSANGGHDLGLWPWGLVSTGLGLVDFGGFFDIVDGRKRSAGGGALRFGRFGVFGVGLFGRRNAGCVLREPRARFGR